MPNIKRIYRAVLRVSIGLVTLGIIVAALVWALRESWNGGRPADRQVGFEEEIRPRGTNAYQMVTGDDSEEDRRQWDSFFSKTSGYIFGKEPIPFLREHIDLLSVGRALDLASAEGRHAVYLAKKGFSVEAVDISEVALRKARLLARENHVTITTVNADLHNYVIQPETYDVILNIHYLQRSLVPQIKRGLKPGGVVVYENYTVDQLKNAVGQSIRRDYLLEKGELKSLFADLEVLVYRETNDGKDAVASLIARKPR